MRRKIINWFLILSFLLSLFPLGAFAQRETMDKAGFHLIQADERGVIIEYYLGEYTIEKIELDGETYDRILLKDASNIGEAGKPNLPLVATSIGVPLEAEFTLRIEDVETKAINGQYRIEPAPVYVVGDEDLVAGTIRYQPDQPTYNSTSAYPGFWVEIGDPAKLRSQRILPIRVYPFQYIPLTGQIEVATMVRFVVEFQYPNGEPVVAASTALAEEENPFEQIYQQSLLNYQEAKRYRAFETQAELPAQLLSENNTSERYKITITEDGIYKLTYEALRDAGMPVDSINPQTFAMTNQGRPVAIYVENNDGNPSKFSPGEYILFFGERLDGTYLASLYADEDDFWRDSFYRSGETNLTSFTPRFNRYMVEKYTNQNVYWLSYGGDGGPFMEQVNVTPGTAPYLDSFQQRIRFEEQNEWWTHHFTNEDTFFWERVQFSSTIQKNYSLNIPNPTQSGMAILRGEFVSRAHSASVNPDHRQIIYLNKSQNPNPIGTLAWDGLRRYRFELTFPASLLINGKNTLTVEFQKLSGMIADDVYVDWFEIEYPRQLFAAKDTLTINRPITITQTLEKIFLPMILKNSSQAQSELTSATMNNPIRDQDASISTSRNNQIILNQERSQLINAKDSNPQALADLAENFGASRVQVEGFKSSHPPVILAIQNPLQPSYLFSASYSNGVLEFQTNEQTGNVYFIQTPKVISAFQINKTIFEDITSSDATYIFIAPREFIQATQSLANYRQSKDGFITKVVALEEIINQFNFGIYHPRAIKNYLQFAYNNWSPKPVYVLLVGDGHWNFLGSSTYDNPPIYMPPSLQWVDPWQGEVDSANDLVTVDGWDPMPDMLIGRLPVNNASEILAYLTKIQTYESSLGQAWQKRFAFVADANDPSAGNFPQLLDAVILSYSVTDLRKIYLNKSGSSYTSYNTETQSNLPCGSQVGSNQCPNATNALISLLNSVNTGHLVYSGHGYIDGWSKAVVFSNPNVENLTNTNLPILFTLDCLDGYWYYPKIIASDHRGQSLVEIMVRTPAKGAVAAFSPTGLGLATAHDKLQRGFYDYIFAGSNWRLGEASLQAKQKVYQESPLHVDLVHTYTVFGDPALLSPAP